MRVAYILSSPRAASHKLGQMILPQLEAGTHGVEVVGIFFFDDNTMILQKGNPLGERLAKVARDWPWGSPGGARLKGRGAGSQESAGWPPMWWRGWRWVASPISTGLWREGWTR